MKRTFLTLLLSGQVLFMWSQTVVNFTLSQPSQIEVSASDDVTISDIENATLTATAAGGTPDYTYKWSPSTGLNNTNSATPIATPADTTTYTVTVTDNNKCTATAQVTVYVTQHESAVENNYTNGLRIFPNPVGTSFYISLQSEQPTTSVSLYTLDGKELWKSVVATSELAVTALEAPVVPGMYLLKVTSDSLMFTETIIVSDK